MNTIKKLKIRNVKGRDYDLTLSPLTLVTGHSFSGKSVVLDAVKLALLGYHPSLGKRPGDTFKLSGGSSMSVSMELDDSPIPIERTWTVERGSVKFADPYGQLVPSAALDAREYFAMSGPDRLKYACSLVPSSVSEEQIVSRLRAIQAEEPSGAANEAVDAVVAKARKLAEARREEDATVQEWVEAMLQEFKELKRGADAAVKQMAGVVQGSVLLREQSISPPRNVDAELAAARKRAADAKAEVDAAAKFRRHRREAKQLRDLLESGPSAEDLDKAFVEASRRVDSLKAKLAAEPASSTPATIAAKSKASAELDSALWRCENIKEAIVEADEKFKEDSKLKKCPFCKSSREGWRDHLAEEHKERVRSLKAELLAFEKAAKAAKAAKAKADEAHEKAAERDEKLQALSDQLDAASEVMESAKFARAERASKQSQLEAVEKVVGKEQDVEELAQAAADADREVEELESAHREYVATQAKENQARAAAENLQRQKAAAEVAKLAVEELRKVQQESVDAAIGGLLWVVNKFTEGIMRERIEYRDGSVGYYSGGQWVSHETFSGTEQELTYAGLAVALAAQSRLKIVLMDEIGVMDDETAANVARRMEKLVAEGVIAQFIGCAASADPRKSWGEWLVVDVGHDTSL